MAWSALSALSVAQLLEQPCVARPVALHLDPDAQVDLAVEQALHVPARCAGNALQLPAIRADHDRLLAVTFHPDGRLDPAQTAFFLEALDRHVAAVRQLLTQQLEHFLAQDLSGEKAL